MQNWYQSQIGRVCISPNMVFHLRFQQNVKLQMRVLTENFVSMKRVTSRLSTHFIRLGGSEMLFRCGSAKHCSCEATRKLLSHLISNQFSIQKVNFLFKRLLRTFAASHAKLALVEWILLKLAICKSVKQRSFTKTVIFQLLAKVAIDFFLLLTADILSPLFSTNQYPYLDWMKLTE